MSGKRSRKFLSRKNEEKILFFLHAFDQILAVLAFLRRKQLSKKKMRAAKRPF